MTKNNRSKFPFGKALLTVWIGFNLLLALSIVVSMTFFHTNAPAVHLLFDTSSLSTLDPRALATINSLAILMNSVITAFCFMCLMLIWNKRLIEERSLFWTVVSCLTFVQLAGFLSDSYLGNSNFMLNLISTGVLGAGMISYSLIN